MQEIDVRDYQYLISKDARLPTGEIVRVEGIKDDGTASARREDGTEVVCDVTSLTPVR